MSNKVSVLMAVYKTNPAYLKQAVESILKQTFTDFEFVIVDDGSNDSELKKILTDYGCKDSRVKVFYNKQNLGISATRNKLIALASGEYLAVMDHDDISMPERLEKEVSFLDQNPEIGVVGSWYQKFPQKKIKKRYCQNHQIEKDLMFNCAILHTSAMIRKSVLVQNKIGYEEAFSPAEDYALWCRLIGKTQFANIPEILLKYRDYPGNTSKTQADKMKIARKKVYDFVRHNQPDLYAAACREDCFKFLGIPLMTKKMRGNRELYKLFGRFIVKKINHIELINAHKLPIYIISFNRLSYLKELIAKLESYRLFNIHIIDNCSSYPPLLEYYKTLPYQIHYMKQNLGHMVFFKDEEFKHVRENEYYVLTDPDVIPVEQCPQDFICLFYQLLQKYPKVNKVGFSLKTDDLPANNQMASLVMRWEQQYYRRKLNFFGPSFYKSCLDTTFALYRPQKEQKDKSFYSAIRTGFPYQARHLPWYKDLSNLTEEDRFYNALDCGCGNWNNAERMAHIEEQLLSKNVYSLKENLFSIKQSPLRKIIRFIGLKFTFNRR